MIARLLLEPDLKLPQVPALLGRRVRDHLRVTPDRHQVEMDAGQLVRVSIPEAGGDERAPVPALRAEPLEAEHPGHQLGQAVRHSLNPEARLAWREGQAVAGQ